ncbi:MAG TPA: MATE family efflux transporter [Planctomycetaceae bacterium]|nr:MATE family efflux transporter [Planctomycetaceae bacterium]
MPDTPSASVAGVTNGIEAGNLRNRVLLLAVPALGEQLLNFCVSLFDTWLAGQVSTADHEPGVYTTTVGIASYVSWLATLIFLLVGIGTTALVARAHGAGGFSRANRFACQSMTLAGLVGLLVFLLLFWMAPVYAHMQQLTGESLRVAVGFLRTDAWGQLFFGYCLIGAAALRAVGDMRTPLFVLGVFNILNIIVSSTLVFGLGPIRPWGIDGIVAGTLTARICGGLLMLAVLARGVSGLRLRRRFLWPHGDDIRRILRIGAPAALDGVLMWSGQWLFLMIIARLGDEAAGKAYMAAHMIGMEAEALTYLPATAWGYAAATLIGQNLGARDSRSAKRLGNEAARQAVFVALLGAAVYLLAADGIYTVMTRESAVRTIGAPALRFLSWYQVPLAVMVVYVHAIRGAGDTRSVLALNLLGIFLVRLPVAWLLGIELKLGLIGAWSGMCADVTLRAIVATIYFSRGRWARVRV